MSNMQQNEDGSWSEATPLGWQGHGMDWEVYSKGEEGRSRYVACGYDEDILLATVKARTIWGLDRKMRREEKKHGLVRNGVLKDD